MTKKTREPIHGLAPVVYRPGNPGESKGNTITTGEEINALHAGHHPTGYRQIIFYGEALGTAGTVEEIEDGAIITIGTSDPNAPDTRITLNSENLMRLTRMLAGWFGHALVHPQDWREKLKERVTAVCELHETRCLDDDIDRRVVIGELIKALVPETP